MMTKEYQMVVIVRSESMTSLTTQNRYLMVSQNGVSGIITIKSHTVDDRQRDCIGFHNYGSAGQEQ